MQGQFQNDMGFFWRAREDCRQCRRITSALHGERNGRQGPKYGSKVNSRYTAKDKNPLCMNPSSVNWIED